MSDYGITVSSPNVDTKTASITQQLLTTKYPLMKLDRNNPVSFQNIRIMFNNEPPSPTANNTNNTLLYSFKHNYSYTPAIWSFCKADGVTIAGVTGTSYFTDSGLIGGNDTVVNTSFAQIKVGADTTYCYIYIVKFTNSTGTPTYVAGAALNFRFYVFAQDVSSTS